jgi:FADH2 O2-dependent halogenase
VDQNYTYHVDRGLFDNLLLHHANQLGAKVFEGVAVTDVDVDAKPFPEVSYSMGRRQARMTARIVVDASGRRTFMGNRLKLKVNDDVFDQYAIHTWFDGYDRSAAGSAGKGDYIYVHFLPITNSWVWQIPITDTVTSVGVVTQRRHFRAAGKDRGKFFWECVDSRPELGQALRAAKQVRGFTEEGDYSYAMQQITGDNWLMVGDAGRFVDPIFSTGVSIALNSARFATPDILRALETGDCRRESFSAYEATLRRGTRNWYNFITVYYRLNILFTAFINDRRYRLDVLKLLQGDVYEEQEPEVLTIMREKVAAIEDTPTHPWHKLLGDLTANAFKPAF